MLVQPLTDNVSIDKLTDFLRACFLINETALKSRLDNNIQKRLVQVCSVIPISHYLFYLLRKNFQTQKSIGLTYLQSLANN